MAKKLQITIDAGPAKQPLVHITPVDIPLSDEAAVVLQQAIAIADTTDANPGDGKIEVDGSFKVPVRFLFVNTNLPVDYELTLKVVDR